jgi:hypothetical protein
MRLEQQIIVADCQVLIAILNFLQQDWGSYMKGAWVLRKAWKIYQKTYAQIRHLYIKRIGLGGNSLGKKLCLIMYYNSFVLQHNYYKNKHLDLGKLKYTFLRYKTEKIFSREHSIHFEQFKVSRK